MYAISDIYQEPQLQSLSSDFIEASMLNPEFLEIEITESAAMTDVNFTVSVLQQLLQMGIRISLDDFGTGYSSLWSLQNLPLNSLKIDRLAEATQLYIANKIWPRE